MTREAVATARAPAAVGPYSQAIKTDGLVFASGQLGLDPQSGTLRAGLEEQTQQALTNLAAVLEAAGTGLQDVVKTTIFLVDLSQFGVVNRIYATAFNGVPPARSTVQVAALPLGGLIEIEAIAVVR
ncbi:MAG: reactive intermediate/imine deaminase [Chloroflexi bacterium]|nr:MAG: reactive intermediate/imine deaminase [Chloroflexota bacterium]